VCNLTKGTLGTWNQATAPTQTLKYLVRETGHNRTQATGHLENVLAQLTGEGGRDKASQAPRTAFCCGQPRQGRKAKRGESATVPST
jgi:hypothetical protein